MLAKMRLLLVLLLYVLPLSARVARVEITSRVDVLAGQSFGAAGVYQRITGRVYFALPVANARNLRIVDIVNAENLQNGEVEFSSDFLAVRPKDPLKSNGSMILEVPNRGNSRILGLVDGGDWNLANDAGDGWLLRNGFSIVSVGWQWDAPGKDALKFSAPIARDHGKTITGLLRGDFMPSHAMTEVPLGHFMTGNIGGTEYPVEAPNDPRNVLTVRDTREGPRTLIARNQWGFGPDGRSIHLQGGFQPGKIYEYVYVVANPMIAGGGFAAIRDFAAYSKHDPAAIAPAGEFQDRKV